MPGRTTATLDAALRDLDVVRRRTRRLVAALPPDREREQPSPVVSPPSWDLGHIAWFEDRWLVQALGAEPVSAPERSLLYDADSQPRPERGGLPLPDLREALAYQDEVRRAALRVAADLAPDAPLAQDAFVHRMIVNHEAQHQENMLHGLARTPRYAPPRETVPPPRLAVEGMARIPAGKFILGSPPGPGLYDNESGPVDTELGEYWLDRAPVANREYLAFLEAGGYDEPSHWSEDGWLLRQALGWEHPLDWELRGDGWMQRSFDQVRTLDPGEPVTHVSFYEAEAYARWAGKRLPTEQEWEKACSWDPIACTKRAFPWGDAPLASAANVGQRTFRAAPVGAFPEGASAYGIHQMIGDVWEWTSSELKPYAGFRAHPYPGYSVPWMQGGWFVLRGGSWATQPSVARPTFRNWAQPDHRHLFAGFRCASDTEVA